MKWFLIAYLSSGLSVAVSQPQDKEFCETMQSSEESYYQKRYAFKCEQHKKRPKLTGKVDSELHRHLSDTCYGLGKACGMEQEFDRLDKKHGRKPGTSSTRYWKERER